MRGGHTMFGAAPQPAQAPPQPTQAPPGSRRGGIRKLLVAAGVVVAVALVVGGFFLGKPFWSPSADNATLETLSYGDGGEISSFSTNSTYDCVNTPVETGRAIGSSNWVDCEDERHDAEFFYNDVAIGSSSSNDAVTATYPGHDRLVQLAEAQCAAAFHSSAIRDQERDDLEYRALVPTQSAWEERPSSGDDPVRAMYCVASRSDGGPMTGTVSRSVE